MIYSMTGFGKAEGNVGQQKVSFMMKSLNSKSLDLNLRLPSAFKEIEADIRKQLSKDLYRGKVELSINLQDVDNSKAPKINSEVFLKYYEQIEDLSKKINTEVKDPIALISRFPEIFSSEEKDLEEEEKNELLKILQNCVSELNTFRAAEGKELEADLEEQINEIEKNLEKALMYEEDRIQNVRSRIDQKLQESEASGIDKDRFEQELIYYMEKFDISEEKVRLRSHCQYFLETLQTEDQQGKKLNFIAQEIGREINTLGSKANHAEMQKLVVLMKESLEKIKEQVLNVL